MGKLTDRRVHTVTTPGRHPDGDTLYLVVSPSGAKSWVQRLSVDGRRVDLGLGGYPAVSLAQARRKALDNRSLARSGGNPLAKKREVAAEAAMPTFEVLARRHVAEHQLAWKNAKHRAQWLSTLQTYAFPAIGAAKVNDITRKQVVDALSPIWSNKPETARRVRQRIRAVMDRAVALDHIDFNPAGDSINGALARMPRIRAHHRALPYRELPAALRVVRGSSASASVKLAFEMLGLTAGRSGEVRGMTWIEVDLERAVWAIPGDRMKAGKTHRVPLSQRALDILEEARFLGDGCGLVFPGPRSEGRISDMAFTQLLRRLGLDFVPHGLRSSFRDWAAEQTQASHATMESALAHTVGNATEAAYFRSDLFELRKTLMDEWCAFLQGDSGNECDV